MNILMICFWKLGMGSEINLKNITKGPIGGKAGKNIFKF